MSSCEDAPQQRHQRLSNNLANDARPATVLVRSNSIARDVTSCIGPVEHLCQPRELRNADTLGSFLG